MKKFTCVLLNLCFPGLGHFSVGQKTKAIVFATCVCLTYLIGLSLDFDHYYWYENIHSQDHTVTLQLKPEDSPDSVAHPLKSYFVNPYTESQIDIANLTPRVSTDHVAYFGHTKPGLTLEIVNENTGDKVQTQSDYRGFFSFEPLELIAGENKLTFRPANEYFTEQAGREIHVANYDLSSRRYSPGTLEKLWHFIYKMVFPVLSTPALHYGGGVFQGLILSWWETLPLVVDQPTIPAPLRDVGFYFVILACMFNLLILFDGYDTCYNEEFKRDLP